MEISNEGGWAPGAARYGERAKAARLDEGGFRRPSLKGTAKSQHELTGVFWDSSAIEVSGIQPSATDRARFRFRASLPELIWNAAALEGNTFTLVEVRTLLDGVTIEGKRLAEEQQILALSDAYSRLDQIVNDGSFSMDESISDELHLLVSRHEALDAGKFRGDGDVHGGGIVHLSDGTLAPGRPEESLHEGYARMIDYLENEIADPRMQALVYFAAATRWQFYFDGNKRTARLMMSGILMSQEFDVVSVPFRRRREFNLALDEMFRTDDATALMAFLATCTI